MKRSRGNWKRRNPLLNQRGLCLSELLMATAVGTVVLAGSLEALNLVHARATEQQRAMAGQQDLRLGLEVWEQEVRMASAGAITMALADRLEFSANIHALETATTATIAAGQILVPVQDGGGWGQGKTVRICSASGCESHRLARTGLRQQLELSEPLSSLFPAGSSVEVMNRVAYYTRADDAGNLRLMRMIDGGAGALIGDLQSVRWSYWDDRGRAAAETRGVARVVVTIEPRDALPTVVREVSVRS